MARNKRNYYPLPGKPAAIPLLPSAPDMDPGGMGFSVAPSNAPPVEAQGLQDPVIAKYGIEGARRRAERQAVLAQAGLSTDIRNLTPEQLRRFRRGGSGMTAGLGFLGMGRGY